MAVLHQSPSLRDQDAIVAQGLGLVGCLQELGRVSKCGTGGLGKGNAREQHLRQ